MIKKVAIISAHEDAEELFDVFQELDRERFAFSVISGRKTVLSSAQKRNWPAKKLLDLIILPKKNWLFLFFLPIYLLLFLPYVVLLKWRDHYQTILCCDLCSKIIFTPWARLMKIKIIWFVYPEADIVHLNKLLASFLRLWSKRVKIITSTLGAKKKLIASGFENEAIKNITLGANLNLYRHQDNIFSKLASAKNHWPQRKFFTIGTVTCLDQKQNIETLFNATKKLLDVIPFPQIVIVGEGQERKNLTWLAKKMEIDNFVWFVGEQNNLKKWLDTFDVFVATNEVIKLSDLNIVMRAMAAGLPIIGPTGNNLEEIVNNNENGLLIEMNNSEDLAQVIIKLQQRQDWRRLIGEKNKNRAATEFNIEKTVAEFTKLLS